jgi:hypothetical protein
MIVWLQKICQADINVNTTSTLKSMIIFHLLFNKYISYTYYVGTSVCIITSLWDRVKMMRPDTNNCTSVCIITSLWDRVKMMKPDTKNCTSVCIITSLWDRVKMMKPDTNNCTSVCIITSLWDWVKMMRPDTNNCTSVCIVTSLGDRVKRGCHLHNWWDMIQTIVPTHLCI